MTYAAKLRLAQMLTWCVMMGIVTTITLAIFYTLGKWPTVVWSVIAIAFTYWIEFSRDKAGPFSLGTSRLPDSARRSPATRLSRSQTCPAPASPPRR